MHMIVGNGEMPAKELKATLDDLWQKAIGNDEEYWFTILALEEPTATHKALTNWLRSSEVYFEVITDDPDNLDTVYDGSQKTHKAAKTTTKAINLLKAAEDGGDVLGLFVNLDVESEEDNLVLDVLQGAIDNGFKGFALNDSMTEIDLSEDEAEAEEEEEKPAPVKKAAAKKAAPAKKAAAKVEGPRAYTAEELEELTDPEIRAIGNSLGITTRGRENWVNKILEQQAGVEETEVEIDGDDEVYIVPDDESEAVAETVGAAATLRSFESSNGAMVIVVNPSTGSILVKPLTPEMADAIVAE